MKKILILNAALLLAMAVNAQKYFTKNATLTFTSKAPMETIIGTNKTGTLAIDSKTGAVGVSVVIKGFVFDKQLLQQHFNENYMESDKFPKGEFKGTISNNTEVKYTVDGTYNAKLAGKLTIHGVTKDVTTTAKIAVTKGVVSGSTTFTITLADYGISIPEVVKDKISKTVTIAVSTGNLTATK
jgi:hypothetical protein